MTNACPSTTLGMTNALPLDYARGDGRTIGLPTTPLGVTHACTENGDTICDGAAVYFAPNGNA